MMTALFVFAAGVAAADAPRDTLLRLALVHGWPEKWNVDENFATFGLTRDSHLLSRK